ncbi:Syntaxin-like t-snare protein tlg2 [Mycena sanguinolenta]|uniref:Syntaxin-like t-snare protein tlg2 n=1 Tax=Mycena sanguinolenta TaxID=230812 RepID=A0A8H6ZH28_9AGAR|nr:Syntaxin-like t-snare protein tlg2 [Mycena sanguinolenta]
MDILVRSRTGLFLSYRDSRARLSRPRQYPESPYALADDEHEGLIPASPGHTAVDLDLPPKWVDISEQVQDILADTQAKITALEKLHAKHVLPGFTDRSSEEREIDAITTDITKDFRRCQALIQRIGTQPHSFPPSHQDAQPSTHAALAAKNVQRGLAAKVQDLSATFRKKQRVYMEIHFTELQGHAIKNQDLLIASGTISLKGSEGMSAVDDDVAAATNTQVQSLSGPSQDLTQRDRELTEIAKSISQLAELFKDLSVLVIDQGTLLDSVEYNIEQTAFQMEDAVRELKVATGYQKNTGRRQCIFLLLLIIFGLIVVLIFKPKRHSSAPPPPPPQADERRLIIYTI